MIFFPLGSVELLVIMGDLCKIYQQGPGCQWLLGGGHYIEDNKAGKLITENPFWGDEKDAGDRECVSQDSNLLAHTPLFHKTSLIKHRFKDKNY